MVDIYAKYSSVEDFMSLYTIEERIISFQKQIGLFNTGHKEDVILKVCFEEERPNMSPYMTHTPLLLSIPLYHS